MNTSSFYESKVIDSQIAYWKFHKDASADTFMEAFPKFNEMVSNPSIKSLMVVVEMQNAWGKEIQDLWIKTGDVLDEKHISKWAVVSQEKGKELTIKYLVKGANQSSRKYEHLVTRSETEALSWLGQR